FAPGALATIVRMDNARIKARMALPYLSSLPMIRPAVRRAQSRVAADQPPPVLHGSRDWRRLLHRTAPWT
ncbi:MAG: hypothetical protein E6813_38335, partial [Bradyrhizobium sp.]|uniref:hypothetical protein n=1 Tax=Bradyrhizobium sp. TaxID=376 RepID=UPI002904C989